MSALKKLMDARIQLQNTELKKSGHNKFANYTYFELSDFLPTVQKIFQKSGLAGVVSYGTDTAKLTITDTDSQNGDSVVIETPMASAALKGCHDVQNLGAVQTYLRRYLWVTAMEIVEHDALDSGHHEKEEKPPAKNTLPVMTDIDFQKNKYDWIKLIDDGKNNAAQIVAAVSKRKILTKKQKDEILSWDKEMEDIPQ